VRYEGSVSIDFFEVREEMAAGIMSGPVSLYPIPEPIMGQKFGRLCVRFVHLSPNAPALYYLRCRPSWTVSTFRSCTINRTEIMK
jgi:hypothetical protein